MQLIMMCVSKADVNDDTPLLGVVTGVLVTIVLVVSAAIVLIAVLLR